MNTAYEPKKYEQKILESWDNSNTSQPETKENLLQKSGGKVSKQSFCVPIPPPNVTGQLHLGHAMMLVIQDIMTRYNRMNGTPALWLPGTDHAAIATETVVLKNLGVSSREEFTRPEFMQKCFDHTEKTHATISNQVKKMGATCDFSRERFTMDIGMSNAVQKIFADLYKHDLIVRGYRMINWSTGAQSVLSDDELEYEDQTDTFCYIKCGKFVMGTVRSETKCANSPLVLHPTENYVTAKFTDSNNESEEFVFSEVLFDDVERRTKIFNQLDKNGTWEKVSTHTGKHFEGETFSYETYSGKRDFFVLCDDEVIDINKGTGAMTISVCHSADDYLLAQKYPEKLKNYYTEKINFEGKMTKVAGELEGVEIKIARKRAVKLMQAKNLIVGLEKDYVHNVPLCYRTGCVIEPMISPQWFIDVNKEFDWQEGVGAVLPSANASQNKVFYARHGQSEANLAEVFQGTLDSPLTEKGEQDAKNLAKSVAGKNITTLISSNLQRANKTAQIVKSENNIECEIIIIPELHEIDWGNLTGKPSSEHVPKNMSNVEFYYKENAGTETLSDVYSRVKIALQKIKEISKTAKGDILVVGHGQISGVIFGQLKNISEENYIDFYKNNFQHPQNGEVRELDINSLQRTSLKKLTSEAINRGEYSKDSGLVNLVPNRFNKIYDQWIDNLQDWCISRQIWWGHQIPIWYDKDGNQHVAQEQKLFFTRHGESENNVNNIICGDSPLTEKGRKQAENLGEELFKRTNNSNSEEKINITKIISSPAERALDTAKIASEKIGYSDEIETWDILKEFHAGKYENTPKDTKTNKTALEKIQEDGGFEAIAPYVETAKQFWEKIKTVRTDGDILIVAHNALTSFLFAVKAGATKETIVEYWKRWSMDNCEVKESLLMIPPIGHENMRQDKDTLDTWFSSGLWPFSTLGWPDKTPDFDKFFPTSVLETGHDILFFWVARMIMFSKFTTGKNPFSDVYLHGLVCDEKGKKMSKSKGNGIDPLEMIEKFGTDAVRMALIVGTTPGNQVNLGEKKIEGFRNFANKLWNVSRYILSLEVNKDINNSEKSLPEKWILSKTQTLITEVAEGIENHKYGEVGQRLYDFTWNDVADWAIESSKSAKSETTAQTLQEVLTTLLKLLHPYIPFVTEQIWKEMGNTTLLALADFPKADETKIDKNAEEKFEIFKNVTAKIRSLRSASKVDPVKKIKAILFVKDSEILSELENTKNTIMSLSRLETLEFITDESKKPNEKCVNDIINGTEIFLPLAGMINPEEEKKRKEKELEDSKKILKNLEGRIANKKYMDNAPQKLVEQTMAQYEEIKEKIKILES